MKIVLDTNYLNMTKSCVMPSSGSGSIELLHTKVLSPSEFLTFHRK